MVLNFHYFLIFPTTNVLPKNLKSFTIFLSLLLLGSFLIPEKLCAQTLNGDPLKWPAILNNAANTKKGFKHDPFNALHVDDQWTGGSSDADVDPTTNWHWVYGNS